MADVADTMGVAIKSGGFGSRGGADGPVRVFGVGGWSGAVGGVEVMVVMAATRRAAATRKRGEK